ncbi:hypothetical protein FHS82_001372 [Pseudochelatococcus lubricantis]|uniref:Uncharacterized protein n=1 Tax=Pseudochelatococcus lubricantis TaxID=1538102 RepID=A0ABX0V3C6_9HYPH|nr:hypothetical protein [Pseudochelatococcus lubricantis]NIJ57546.1 hypothetical protein [Pseudochelatococcus lubricantis]
MGIRPRDVTGEVFLFADAFNIRDMFHCRMIIENYPNGHFINVPLVEHHVTTVFAGTVNLQELLDACVVGDVTTLRKISRRTRRSHPIWKDRWLKHAMRKLPRLGIDFLLDPNNRDQLRKNWRYFPFVLTHLARTVSAGQATAFYDGFWPLLPGPIEQQLVCAYLVNVVGRGRVGIATTHTSWLMYDLSKNRVIHKVTPVDLWDIPVEAEFRSSTATLFVMVGGTKFHLSMADNGWLDVADGKGRTQERFLFEIRQERNGQFTISQGGKYLSAERPEVVICNRNSAKDWEMFRFGSLAADLRERDVSFQEVVHSDRRR